MKKILAFICLLFALFTTQAHAQFGVHGGYDVDVEEFLLGGQVRFPLGALPITLQPGVDVFLVDRGTLLQFDVNALYDISGGLGEPFTPYVGAGLGLRYFSIGDIDDTNAGLNLLAGARFNPASSIQPFVQARMTIADGTSVAVMGGILFALRR